MPPRPAGVPMVAEGGIEEQAAIAEKFRLPSARLGLTPAGRAGQLRSFFLILLGMIPSRLGPS